MWEIDALCLPKNIPEKIIVDISKMEIGDVLTVAELVLPEGVKTEHDSESVVATVAAPMKEEEEPVDGEAEDAEPEVIKKEKNDDEAEGDTE